MLFDIVLLLLFFYMIYIGYRRGFISSVFDVTGDVICLMCAYLITPKFENFINLFAQKICDFAQRYVSTDFIINNIESLSYYISKTMIACVIFIVIRIILNLIKRLLKIPLKLNSLSSLDRIAGAIFATIKFVVICSCLGVIVQKIFIANGYDINSYLLKNIIFDKVYVYIQTLMTTLLNS